MTSRAEAARRVAPLFARALARLDSVVVVDVHVPAEPAVIFTPTVGPLMEASRSNVHVDHGARVDPIAARLDDPGADTP